MRGGGVKKDIDNMQYLAENMLGRTFCPLGDAAAMPTIAFVKKFRKEFEDHLDGRPCPYEKEGAAEAVAGMADRLGHLDAAFAGSSRRMRGSMMREGQIAQSPANAMHYNSMADVTSHCRRQEGHGSRGDAAH